MTEKRRKKIIIDTDCGSDDAMAIAMALNDPAYEILFFTVTAGNVTRDQAVRNTLTTIEKAGTYEPPVYAGADRMILKELAFAYETHGMDGMGDLGFTPERLLPAEGHGVWKLLEALRASEEGEIDIITLGPLTNLALALRLETETVKKAGRIVIMGGAGFGGGNVTAAAEFNIWQDGEAARIVLEAGLKNVILVGWDACLGDCMLNEEEIGRLRESGSLGRFAVDANRVLMELNRQRFGQDCLDMADPAAMAAALYPDCIREQGRYYCQVDTSCGPSYGAVLIDRYGFSGKEPNATVCSRLWADRYKEYLFRTLGGREKR